MGIPLLAGRLFAAADGPDAPRIVIINEALARGFWPDPTDPPLGKRIVLGAPRPGVVWMTIVGVVGDVRASALDRAPQPQIYIPYDQAPGRSLALIMRAGGEPDGLIALSRAAVAALDPEQPVHDLRTMDQRLSAALAAPRFQTLLAASFAVLALILAATGIYGVVSHSVVRRTREIGIRMALGAEPRGVLGLVLSRSMKPVVVGLAIGMGGAWGAGRVLHSLLFEVSPSDPVAFAVAPMTLVLAALAACYLPARRATRVDPMAALRHE